MMMNTDKAYLIGLTIGGGIFGNAEDVFRIHLPYKKWGSYEDNPKRAGEIAKDILSKVGQMFRAIYGMSVQYETSTGGNWTILCEGDQTTLRADLNGYGITCAGELRQNIEIGNIIIDLVDDNLKRRFIAGLADTIGSMAKSHRRFTDEMQIISFEINGFNFKFVCDLCRLLYSINCIPDQILWNHPNFHCTNDPYYKQWTKGFKLRILLDQYAQFGAFTFRTKAKASQVNRSLQQQTHQAEPCPERTLHVTPTCVHPAEHDKRLPAIIKGGHFIHNRHVCAVMGCEHAPYKKISNEFLRIGELITPFPIQSKKCLKDIEEIINNDPLLQRNYSISKIKVEKIYNIYKNERNTKLYGTNNKTGYPISEILQAIAYIVADDSELNGTRIKGNYEELIKLHLERHPNLCVEIRKPDLLTPLVIVGNGRGVFVGAENPDVYAKLVSRDPSNEYKLRIRQITEEDLHNA